MLKTENINNGPKALTSFFRSMNIRSKKREGYSWDFEHGQLWIHHANGGTWSVVDAEGPNVVNGFDFECVSEPEHWM